jgi:hypothetical protein
VRVAIVRRMQDISPSVRDAAIKLAGNYLASHPEGTPKYLDAISERILVSKFHVSHSVKKSPNTFPPGHKHQRTKTCDAYLEKRLCKHK